MIEQIAIETAKQFNLNNDLSLSVYCRDNKPSYIYEYIVIGLYFRKQNSFFLNDIFSDALSKFQLLTQVSTNKKRFYMRKLNTFYFKIIITCAPYYKLY